MPQLHACSAPRKLAFHPVLGSGEKRGEEKKLRQSVKVNPRTELRHGRQSNDLDLRPSMSTSVARHKSAEGW
ncbi:hypothetical protein TcWFU_006608 [Taenia crassiceps]|uniref:Uncharacterized protein n=1 Tax=Taenia crassiceps TaxID=6207 RepID=A0ABR4Q3B9_9CEST